MCYYSVIELFHLAFICLISVQLIGAYDLPILHSGCNEYEDGTQPTQLPYPNDCTKFYKCSGGYAFTLNCPQGLHWSVKYNRCDFPAEAGCKKSDGNEVSEPITPPSSLNGDTDIVIMRCPVGENPNEPTHLPYPGDCTKFFKCKIGNAYPLNCPMGLHWSVFTNRCDWPVIAKCAKVNSKPPASSTAATSPTSAPTPVPTKTASSAPTPAPTPAQTPASAPTPAPASAQTPAPTPAPSPAPTPTPTPAPTPTPTSPTTPPTTPVPTPAWNPSATELNLLCKNISSGFLSYRGNCRRYVQCANGNGKINNCPGNLYFNSKIGVCSRICG